MGSELSEKYWMQLGVHQGFGRPLLVFASAVDAITKRVRQGPMNEICCAGDLTIICSKAEIHISKVNPNAKCDKIVLPNLV